MTFLLFQRNFNSGSFIGFSYTSGGDNFISCEYIKSFIHNALNNDKG